MLGMMTPRSSSRLPALFAFALLLGCAEATSHAAPDLPKATQDLKAAPDQKLATAVFAGGCFWCVEAGFEIVKGVTDVVSGYAGGDASGATYERVSAGATQHAESVRVTYDPTQVSYGQLLRVFFTLHDPTTLDRQGPDHGHQYRSAVFVDGDAQRKVVEAYLAQLQAAKAFAAPIVTTVEPLTAFYPAEAYHQDYYARNPNQGYVRAYVPGKLKKLREKLPELVRPEGKS